MFPNLEQLQSRILPKSLVVEELNYLGDLDVNSYLFYQRVTDKQNDKYQLTYKCLGESHFEFNGKEITEDFIKSYGLSKKGDFTDFYVYYQTESYIFLSVDIPYKVSKFKFRRSNLYDYNPNIDVKEYFEHTRNPLKSEVIKKSIESIGSIYSNYKQTAKTKGYKSGWVYYRMREIDFKDIPEVTKAWDSIECYIHPYALYCYLSQLPEWIKRFD